MTFRTVLTDPEGDIYEGHLQQQDPPLATPRGSKPRVSFSNKDQIILIPGVVNHSKNLTPKSTSQHLTPYKPTNSPTPSPRSSRLKQKSSSCTQEAKPTLNHNLLFVDSAEKKLRQSAHSFILKTIQHFTAIYPKDMVTLSHVAKQNPFYSDELIKLIQKLALDRKPSTGSKFCCFKMPALEPEDMQLFNYMAFLSKLSSDPEVLSQVEAEFNKAFPLINLEKTADTNGQKENKSLAKPPTNK